MNPRLLARSGAVAALDFSASESLLVGAAAGVDIRVEAPGVLPLHATITRNGDGLQLIAESTEAVSATYLNGRRIATERLQHLDVITIGRGVDLIYLAT
jgi:pSer/pThr/pTyr-binding forkhead associated (FHA) protein